MAERRHDTPYSVRDRLRVRPNGISTAKVAGMLAATDPSDTNGVKRRWAQSQVLADENRVSSLQECLFAQGKRSILIVLQGMDTSGKDGTIRHALRGLDPLGVKVVSFKAPTPVERRHNFLWRIRRQLPQPGQIVIFNRSHYEDVLVAKVKELVAPQEIEKRYAIINAFEAGIIRRGTALIKLWLHISVEEQQARLLARLKRPDKRWKFSPHDVVERGYWDAYQEAYATALKRCSPALAPWYVIPANRKWYRNWAVTQVLIETMEDMRLMYPKPRLNLGVLKKQIKAVA
jgi:PPK2 family polyphosphate:nucleotide phosphotransferase